MSAVLPGADDDATTPILDLDGHRATITLSRPAKLNRIEPADLNALAEHLAAVEHNQDLRVLVLTGTGRVFSAGYHLGALDKRSSGRAEAPAVIATFDRVADALANCRIPTICALNGSVYGGATDLALACDFRIGITGSEMLMPACKLGVHYYLSGLQRYVTRLGLSAAKRLFLLAQPIDADEMLRIGYLDQAVAKDILESTVAALAETLAHNAPLSLHHMKRALNQIAANNIDMDAFNAGYQACANSSDLREGLAAWKERRSPAFKGC